MATEYLKITLTDQHHTEPHPTGPDIMYVAYPVWDGTPGTADKDLLGTMSLGGTAYKFSLKDWLGSSFIQLESVSFWVLGDYWKYGRLRPRGDFLAAQNRGGSLSGTYVGDVYGESWKIEHVVHVGDINLPTGEGGEEDEGGITYSWLTPAAQAGGEPPAIVTNPTPTDDAIDVALSTSQLTWDAG